MAKEGRIEFSPLQLIYQCFQHYFFVPLQPLCPAFFSCSAAFAFSSSVSSFFFSSETSFSDLVPCSTTGASFFSVPPAPGFPAPQPEAAPDTAIPDTDSSPAMLNPARIFLRSSFIMFHLLSVRIA